MNFKIDGAERKLVFGVRFTADLDASEKYQAEGIEFGMGLMMTQEKLAMGNYDALAKVIKHALHGENFTVDEVFDALDEYGEENDMEELFTKVEEELKNSNAVRTATARMEKTSEEANRKKGTAQALKLIKK